MFGTMKWQKIIKKHLDKFEASAENAFNAMRKELCENNLSLTFDDNFKEHFLCQFENR